MFHHEEWKDAQTFSWSHLCHSTCVVSEWSWKDKVSSFEGEGERQEREIEGREREREGREKE